MPRPILTFVAVIAIAALIAWPAGSFVHPAIFWGTAFVVGVALAIALPRRPSGKDEAIAAILPEKGEFLCDRCRYNLDSACSTPGRPNVTRCDGYQPSLRDR